VYADNTGDLPTLIALTLPTSEMPKIIGADPDTVVSNLLSQAATPGTTVQTSSGRHGGSMQCAYSTSGAVHETLCAWSDGVTTGLLVSVEQPVMTPEALGTVGNDFRDYVD
jgi:hypothetical protein